MPRGEDEGAEEEEEGFFLVAAAAEDEDEDKPFALPFAAVVVDELRFIFLCRLLFFLSFLGFSPFHFPFPFEKRNDTMATPSTQTTGPAVVQ